MNLPPNAIRLTDKIQIWKIPNFATNEECDQLIQDATKAGYQRSEVDSKKKGKTEARTSTTSFIKGHQTKTGLKLGEKAKKVVGADANLEGIQVQRYLKDQKYNPHFDTFEQKDGVDQRSWTLMVYLNDVEEGGGTYFPKIDFRIMPEKGTAILWNNLDANNCRDNNTLHMGEPINKGEKYISTYWFRKSGNAATMCPQAPEHKFNMKLKDTQVPLETKDSTGVMIGCGCCLMVLLIALLIYFIFYSKKLKSKK